jgi:periplasmic protein CpxP/Spy
MTPPSENSVPPAPARRRWFAGLAALGGLGLLGSQVKAQAWGRRPRLDPEEMARRFEYRIGRMVDSVGGTPDQKDRIVAIVRAAAAELQPVRQQLMQARRSGIELLAAPVIDRAALEQLRASQLQLVDAKSRRVSQAFADAADVLAPQQRAQLAERMRQRIEARWRR